MCYVATTNAAKAKPQVKPKICVDCKYFIKKEGFYSHDYNRFGKCSLFPHIETRCEDFLVTGIEYEEIIDYKYCSTARTTDYMCGEEGKRYEQK